MFTMRSRGAGPVVGRRRLAVAAVAGFALAGAAAAMVPASAALAADAGAGVFGERRTVAPAASARLRSLSGAERAGMDAARAAELLAAVTVTREGALGRQEAGADAVRLFVAESRRSARGAAAAEGSGPVGEGVAPEVVIPPDQRVRVADTRRAPFRSIGRTELGCTGAVVGPRHVLTAAHCVYDRSSRRYVPFLDFTPAQSGGLRPFGTFSWVRALAPQGYTRDGLFRFDYALIVLSRPVPAGVGVLRIEARPLPAGLPITIAGYPADKPRGTMWRSSCGADGVRTQGLLVYDCDTAGGNSGSPVLPGGGAALVAVHGYGFTDDDTGRPLENGAAPITASVRRQIQAWIAAN